MMSSPANTVRAMQVEKLGRFFGSAPRRTLGLAVLTCCLAVSPALRADQESDDVQPTGLTPLALLLGHIHGKIPGNVLKVELERTELAGKHLWVYALKLLTPDGDVLKLRYDAKSLRLIEKRGHGPYADRDDHDDGEHDGKAKQGEE